MNSQNITDKHNGKRTAVLLVGQLRTWDECKENFINTFGDSVDIFICVSNIKYNYAPWIKDNFTGHDDCDLTESDIMNSFDGLNLKKLIIQDIKEEAAYITDEQSKFKMDVNSGFDSFGTYGNIFKTKKVLSALEDYENENGFKYDVIIKTRFDIVYHEIDFSLNDTSILINSGNVFPDDCFLMTNRKSMFDLIHFMHDEFYEPKYNNSHVSPPHGLLFNAIQNNNLSIEPKRLINYVIRKNYGPQYY